MHFTGAILTGREKMSDFELIFNKLDKAALTGYLEKSTRPCYESELLKAGLGLESLSSLDSLTLYRSHFVLFHYLYSLQDEYYQKNKYLHIHFMRIQLQDYPPPGNCRFYHEDTGLFCSVETQEKSDSYCGFHSRQIEDNFLENVSLKYFYLDINNFYKLNRDTAERFINGTWEILAHYRELEESLKILGLPEKATIEMAKKRFKQLAKQYHPDMNVNGLHTNDEFNRINNAYQKVVHLLTPVSK